MTSAGISIPVVAQTIIGMVAAVSVTDILRDISKELQPTSPIKAGALRIAAMLIIVIFVIYAIPLLSHLADKVPAIRAMNTSPTVASVSSGVGTGLSGETGAEIGGMIV